MHTLIKFFLISFSTICFAKTEPIYFKFGFFLGGRTGAYYRMLVNRPDILKKNNLKIDLISKDLNQNKYYTFDPKNRNQLGEMKVTGDELIDLLMKGEIDGAFIGETAFLKAIDDKKDIVAILESGHDTKEMPGHAMVSRSELTPELVKKMSKIKVGVRRSSGGDEVVTREFIKAEKWDEKKIDYILNIDDDKMRKFLKKGKVDISYMHLNATRKMFDKTEGFKIYRKLDWINPEISLAVLVVKRDFLNKNREKLKVMVQAFQSHVEEEYKLSKKNRSKKAGKADQIDEDFQGMNFPQVYKCPKTRSDLLEEWEKLLLHYKMIQTDIKVKNYIDNSLFTCN